MVCLSRSFLEYFLPHINGEFQWYLIKYLGILAKFNVQLEKQLNFFLHSISVIGDVLDYVLIIGKLELL